MIDCLLRIVHFFKCKKLLDQNFRKKAFYIFAKVQSKKGCISFSMFLICGTYVVSMK